MKTNKGFTLVELLIVLVILGLLMAVSIPAIGRLIERGKIENLDSQKKTIQMAAESYAQENKKYLPKSIGESVNIPVKDLKNTKYLKEDIKNADKKSCMEDSYVKVYKYDKDGYTYTPYIYCEGDVVSPEDTEIKPNISVRFTDNKGNTNASQNVAISSLMITIDGNKDSEGKQLGVDGYSYIISVKYNNSDQMVEIFNSGTLNAYGRPSLQIQKSLTDYVDITKASYFLVTVEAYNRIGGYKKVTGNSNYQDTTPPTCGTITGQAGENEWDKTWRTKRISITCSDGDGSGCTQDSYTKTFDTQMNTGTIQIKDNAGNTNDCEVRVHLDWTTPTVTISAYKLTSGGGKGAAAGSITANDSNRNVTFNSYTGGVGTDSWLNLGTFPYGIYYEVTISDNVILSHGKWSVNARGLKKNDANVSNLTLKSDTPFTGTSSTTHFTIPEEGYRKAKYEFNDKAGNAITINLTAPIDRTRPNISLRKSHLDTEDGVTVTATCTDAMSGCREATKVYTGVKSSRTFTTLDVAGNSNDTNSSVARITVNSYACHPYQYVCGSYTCNCYQKYLDCAYEWWDDVGRHCDPDYQTVCSTCPIYCTGWNTCYN